MIAAVEMDVAPSARTDNRSLKTERLREFIAKIHTYGKVRQNEVESEWRKPLSRPWQKP
jgi:hypothetical protein